MASRSEVTDCKLHPFTTRRKPQVHYQLIYVATLPLSYYYLEKHWTGPQLIFFIGTFIMQAYSTKHFSKYYADKPASYI